MVRISNLDVLKVLMKNSKTPFLEMARMLGVSETAIRKRIRKMEEEGVIRAYTVDVDPKKIGFEVNALIGLDTEPEVYLQVIEKLRSMDEIRSLYTSSGDHMIMMEIWFKNMDELSKFVDFLNSMNGVKKVCPAIIMEKIK
ncbi:MAG: Lrp/AsnC family transcriptional regulator [Candidatus Aenigmarchaeota archaeon]|nr:Lrp/AsnC family transcriptional regulator [Candidatus Aenigmarchaeota archaeon]